MGFFEDLRGFKSKTGNPDIPFGIRGSLLFVHTAPLIDLWTEWAYSHTKFQKLIKRNFVREQIKLTPGYISNRACKRINGTIYRCTVFNLSGSPKSLKEILKMKEAK